MADAAGKDVLRSVFYTSRQTFGFAIPDLEQELGVSKSTLDWASAILLWI